LGVMLDHNEANCKMSFSLNGEDQGVAFEHVEIAGNLFAAVTLGQGTKGVFRWKADEVSIAPTAIRALKWQTMPNWTMSLRFRARSR